MSSSDEETNQKIRNFTTSQFSPQLKPHSSLNSGFCPHCNMYQRVLKNSKSNAQILSKSQHLQDNYFERGQFNKLKKNDYSEYERKVQKAFKEIERLNRIVADQSIELEALNFVKSMSQYEVDTVVIQENQRLKQEIEDLQNQLNQVTHPESQADNSETFNYWNDRKDSEKLQLDFFNLELDEYGEGNHDNFNLEYGLNRIDEIKRLLVEEHKFYKHLLSEAGLSVHMEEYLKKRQDLLQTFQKLQHHLFPLFSPAHNQKTFNISRKHSGHHDDVTPSNKSTFEMKLQPI